MSVIERYCVWCRADRKIHADTGRCQTCGKNAGLPQSPNGVGAHASASAPQAAAKLILTETPELRRWLDLTRALAEKFTARAERSRKFADQFQAEADQLKTAAQAFAGLLDQLSIEQRTDAKAWSARHAACVNCGTTTRKHVARGLCTRCYRPGASEC